jgi:hypothetical protein
MIDHLKIDLNLSPEEMMRLATSACSIGYVRKRKDLPWSDKEIKEAAGFTMGYIMTVSLRLTLKP